MGSACRAFSILGGFEIRRATLGGGRVRGGGEGVEKVNPMNCSIDLHAHPDSDSPVCDDRTATVHRG